MKIPKITIILLSVVAILIVLNILLNVSYARYTLYSRDFYNNQFCEKMGGVTVNLWNMTQVDCVANGQAIKISFAHKWEGAIGRSLYYAMETTSKPGIALIIEDERHCEYYRRMIKTIEEFNLPYDKNSLYTINLEC